jgi:hypothetical protein
MPGYNFRERKNILNLYTRTKILTFPSTVTKKSKKSQKSKKLRKNCFFKNMIQDAIVTKLKLTRKSSIVKGVLSISNEIRNYLQNEYDFAFKFKNANKMLRDLAIDTVIFRDERANSPISAQNFEIRIVRLRQNFYNVKDRNQYLKKKNTSKNPIIEFKFTRVTTPEHCSQTNDEVDAFNNQFFI